MKSLINAQRYLAAGLTSFVMLVNPVFAQTADDHGQSISEYTSDAVITTKIKAALIGDKGVSAMKIKVETLNGVVHLTGEVDNAAQIDEAERVAMGVDGVKSVQNDLQIKMAD